MKHMNPKEIFSPRNLIGALVIAVTTAVLFAGTWIIYNEFVKAAPGDGMYNSEMSNLLLEFSSDPDEITNVVACTLELPEGTVCYDASVVTEFTPAPRTGVTIVEVAKGSTMGAPNNTAMVFFSETNALDQDLANYSVTVTNLGGITATINNIMPDEGGEPTTVGGVYYQSIDPLNVSMVTTEMINFLSGDTITTDGVTIACPAEPADFWSGKTCFDTSLFTIINNKDLVEGAAISTVFLHDAQDAFSIVFNNADLILNEPNPGFEIEIQTFNNVMQQIATGWNEPSSNQSPEGTYIHQDPEFGNVTVSITDTISYTDAGPADLSGATTPCPGDPAYEGETCIDLSKANIINSTGLAANSSLAAMFLTNDGQGGELIQMVWNQGDVFVDNKQVEIEFTLGNNVKVLNISTWNEEGPAGPTASYLQQDPGINNVTTSATDPISYTDAGPADLTGATTSCPADGFYDGRTCINLSKVNIIENTGLAANSSIAAMYLENVDGGESIQMVWNQGDVFVDNKQVEIEFTLGNNVKVLNISTWNQATPPPAPSLNMTYESNLPSFGGSVLTSDPLTEGTLDSTNQIPCPEDPAYDSKICYNLNSIIDISGTSLDPAASVVAMYKGMDNQSVIVVMDRSDVLSDFDDFSITLNNFGGITEQVIIDSVRIRDAKAYYTPSNPIAGGDATVGLWVPVSLDNTTNVIDCTTIGITEEGAVCYNANSVTGKFNINGNPRGLVRGDLSTIDYGKNYVLIILDTQNSIPELSTAEISVNNFGGLTEQQDRTSFEEIQGDNPEPQQTTAYNGSSSAGGSIFTTPNLAESLTTDGETSCPAGDYYTDRTCFDKSQTTISGLKNGIGTANILTIVKGNNGPFVEVIMDQNSVAQDLNITLTLNGFGGITETTLTNFEAKPGNVEYQVQDGNFGNQSTMAIATPIALDNSTNTIDCTTIGVMTEGAICYNKDSVTMTGTGITEGITVNNNLKGVLRGDFTGYGDNTAFLIWNQNNVLVDGTGVEITFNNAGGLSEPVTKNTFNVHEPPAPTPNPSLLYNPQLNFEAAILVVETPQDADKTTNTVVCDTGLIKTTLNGTPTCYNPSTVTLNGAKGGVTVDFVLQGDSTQDNLGWDSSNLIIGLSETDPMDSALSNLSVDLTNTGGVTESFNNFTQAGINYAMYKSSNADWGNKETWLTAKLTAGLTPNWGTIGCPQDSIYNAQICVDMNGFNTSGGVLKNGANIEAIVAEGNELRIVWDTNNVIEDQSGLTLSIPKIDIVDATDIGNFMDQSDPVAPESLKGTYWPAEGEIPAMIILDLKEDMDGATNTVACNGTATTCYNPSAISFSGGTWLVDASNIIDVEQDSKNAQQLVLTFNTSNLSSDLAQGVITIANTIGGLSEEKIVDDISEGQQQSTNEYLPWFDGTGTSLMILNNISIDAGKQAACDQEVAEILTYFSGSTPTCYQTSLVTAISGDFLQSHITTSNVWAVVERASIEPEQTGVFVIFDQPDVAWGPENLSITIDGTTVDTWSWGDGMTDDDYEAVKISDNESVWFQGFFIPWEVGTNLATVPMMWSAPLNTATLNTNTIKAYNEYTGQEITPLTISSDILSNGETMATVTFPAELQNNTEYSIKIGENSSVKDANGNAVNYEQYNFFTNSSLNANSGSQLMYSWPWNGETNVDPAMTFEIGLGFDFNQPIVSTGTGTLTPSGSGMTYEIDPMHNEILVYLKEALDNSTNYTLSFPNVTDAYGNTTNTSISFTTGVMDTATSPQLQWVDFVVGGETTVGYNMSLNSEASKISNWTLECDGTPINLSGKAIEQNQNEWTVTILDAGATGNSCTLTAGSEITGLNGVAFAGNDNIITAPTMEEFSYYDDSSSGTFDDMIAFGCIEDCDSSTKAYDAGFIAYGGEMIFEPMNKMAEKTSEEVYVSLPMQSAKTGQILEIQMPSGASFDINKIEIIGEFNLDGKIFWFDKNNATYSTTTKKLKLPIVIDADGDGVPDDKNSGGTIEYPFQIDFIINGNAYTNPTSATSYDWETGNGGAKAYFKKLESTGQTAEDIGYSMPYSVLAAGPGTISGKVTNSVTGDGVEGVSVFIESWIGEQKVTTDSDGNYTATGLVVTEPGSTYGIDYYVNIDPPEDWLTKTKNNFIYLNSNTTSETGVNFTVTEGTIPVTINLSGEEAADKSMSLEIEAFSTNYFAIKKDNVDAGTTNKSSTMMLGPGDWKVCIYPDMMIDMKGADIDDMSGGAMDDYMIPCTTISINDGDTSGTANIEMMSADGSIAVTLADSEGNPIQSSKVYAYNPWSGMGGGDCTTDSNGQCTINVVPNEQYTVFSEKFNMEQSVFVDNGTISNVSFTGKNYSLTVSGKITGDGNKEAWIQVWDDYGFWTGTEANAETGVWAVSVPDNTTLKVESFGPYMQYTASGSNADGLQHTIVMNGSSSSDNNFVKDNSLGATISGSVSPAIADMTICADEKFIDSGDYAYNFNCTATDSNGDWSIQIKKAESGVTGYEIKGYSSNYGDLKYGSLVDNSGGDVSGIVLSAGNLNEVTINITGNPGLNEVFIDLYDPDSWQGFWKDVKMNGATSKTITAYVNDGTYDAWLWTNVGGFTPEGNNGNSSFTINEDVTLTFNMGEAENDMVELTATVIDTNGDPVENSWVEFFNFENGTYVGGETDNTGRFSAYINLSSIKVRADHWDYSTKKTSLTKAELEADPNIIITLGEQKSSSITVNINVAADSNISEFWTDVTDGEFWNGMPGVNATIPVPNSEDLTIYINAINGDYMETTANAGDTISVNYPADFSSGASWLNTDAEPVVQSGNANGISLKDAENGIELEASAGLLNEDFTITAKTVANLPGKSGGEVTPLIGKQITLKDSNGTVTTETSASYNSTFTLTKSQLEGMISDGMLTYDDFSTLNIGYWSANNTWIIETSTKIAEAKANSDSAWTSVTMSDLVANLKTNAEYYYDYRIKLTAIGLDHFTIFSPLTGSDSTAPNAPTGLSASATSSAVTLDWNDNSEGDLLEYEIYRSTSTPVALTDDNQVNTSAVTASTYTDSTVVAGTTYYYAITAVDTSHNESSSIEGSITVPSSGGEEEEEVEVVTITVTPTYGGGASTSPSEEETVEETVEEESGWEGSEHETIEEETEEEIEVSETDYDDHWAASYIEKIIDAGIASGLDENTFLPDAELTRAEMTKMVVIAFDYNINENLGTSPFPDVNPSEWYAPYVEAAYVNGLVGGYPDGTFGPSNNINRAEAMKILVEAYLSEEEVDAISVTSLPFTDVNPDAWYTPYITYGYLEDIVSGYSDGTYKPANNVTRAEFSKIISNLLEL